MPPPVTAASLSTADAGYIENDDEPWHSTCVSKAPVITKGAFDQAYVSSLPFVAPEEALQLAMSSPTLKLKDIDGAIAKCIADGGRKGCPAIVAAEKIKKAADKDGNVKPGKAPGGARAGGRVGRDEARGRQDPRQLGRLEGAVKCRKYIYVKTCARYRRGGAHAGPLSTKASLPAPHCGHLKLAPKNLSSRPAAGKMV